MSKNDPTASAIIDSEITISQLRATVATLTATNAQQAERIAALEQAAREARQQLRATSENWREDCMYRADDILSKAIGDEPKAKPAQAEHDADEQEEFDDNPYMLSDDEAKHLINFRNNR